MSINPLLDEYSIKKLINSFIQSDNSWVPISLAITCIFLLIILVIFAYNERIRTSIKSIKLPGGGSLITNDPKEVISTKTAETFIDTTPTIAPKTEEEDPLNKNEQPILISEEISEENWKKKLFYMAFEKQEKEFDALY